MNIIRISDTSVLIKNVEFYVNFYHWVDIEYGMRQRKLVKQDIIYEDVIFTDNNYHITTGYNLGDYYSPTHEDWVTILEKISGRYSLQPKNFTDKFHLFGYKDIVFKYGKTLSHHMSDEMYNNFLIEKRNKIIGQILE